MNTFYNATDEYYHVDEAEVEDLHKCIWRVISNATWLGFFSVCLLLFTLLSTEKQRRSTLFPFQCCFFLFAVAYNSSAVVGSDRRFKSAWIMDDGAHKAYWSFARIEVANISLEHWITLLADGSVLVHVLETFYPSCSYPKLQRFKYTLPFLVLITARIGLIIASTFFSWKTQYNIQWVPQRSIPLPFGTRFLEAMKGTEKAEFLLAASYEIMISSFLIRKLIQISKEHSESLQEKITDEPSRFQKFSNLIYQVLMMCYTIPIAFRITMIPLLGCIPGYCHDREISLTVANTSVLFSIFATSWSNIKPTPTKDQIERDAVHAYDDKNPAYKSLVFSADPQEVSDPNTLVN